jgi:hypothetical protein
MKNVPPSSSIERRKKNTENQLVMHSLQQTKTNPKKEKAREIMSIITMRGNDK